MFEEEICVKKRMILFFMAGMMLCVTACGQTPMEEVTAPAEEENVSPSDAKESSDEAAFDDTKEDEDAKESEITEPEDTDMISAPV